MSGKMLGLAAERAARGEPFVLATVVWRRGPSSGKAGASALITADGAIEGWLGGACAEPTVIGEALDALVDGRPRLLQLGPRDEFGDRTDAGVVAVPMACESEGAMEIYLEPVIPAPQLVVIGRSPAAAAMVAMGEALGWRSHRLDDVSAGDLGMVTERDFVVVATQGHFDEAALEAALVTPAGYLGLVASRKRADSVLEWLRSRGTDDAALARIHAPAGLDLGSIDNVEIAVAVIAEVVSLKGIGGVATGVAVAQPVTAIDPVCHMTVDVATAHLTMEHEGTTYYFCAPGCHKAFAMNPAAFVAT